MTAITTQTTLSSLSKQAHDRHTAFLQWLIDRRIRRISPEHQQVSNALQAIESIATWREATEWSVKYGKADIAEFAMSRLQEWCDRLSSAVESFGGVDGIFAAADEVMQEKEEAIGHENILQSHT